MKQIFKDIVHSLKSIAFLPRWWAQKYQKRDPYLWTFGDMEGLRYGDSTRALYEYVLSHYPEIHCVWMTRNPVVYEQLNKVGKPVALCGTKEASNIQRNAGYFFATHGRTHGIYDGDERYMNGIQFIDLWHGVPFKTIGEDERFAKYGKRTLGKCIKTAIRKTIIPWDFVSGKVLCGSPFFVSFYQSAFQIPRERVWITPEPRLDKFHSPYKEKLILQLDKEFAYPTKVLYMPTFRDNQQFFNPFKNTDFDMNSFTRILEENNIVFIYKGHFFDGNALTLSGNSRIILVDDSNFDDLYTFIKDVDILVTDYSSVYFDFLYLRKPIILFPFDYDDYIVHSRPFYFDYNLMQAHRVFSWKELAECLADKDYYPPTEEEINMFRPIPAEHCCENIVRELQKELSNK